MREAFNKEITEECTGNFFINLSKNGKNHFFFVVSIVRILTSSLLLQRLLRYNCRRNVFVTQIISTEWCMLTKRPFCLHYSELHEDAYIDAYPLIRKLNQFHHYIYHSYPLILGPVVRKPILKLIQD